MLAKLRREPLVALGLVFLIAVVLFAVFGPAVRDAQLRPPGSENFSSVYVPIGHPFEPSHGSVYLGTDDIGRDVVARLAQGARISLSIGLIVQIISLSLGVLVGVIGVYAPKQLASAAMRFTDAMFAFPDILLAILIISVFKGQILDSLGMFGRLTPVIVALSITSWPSVARLVRAQIASVKDREFVVAAKASGASTTYLVWKHVLPQLMGLLMAVAMVQVADTILAESTLSFIGIGVQPPDPSWGSMINVARQNMSSYPAQLIPPCVILSVTIFALNFVGDGLRALFDPKRAQS